MKKLITLFILTAVLLLSACSGGGEEQNNTDAPANEGTTDEGSKKEEYTFKLTTIVQPTHSWVKTAEKFNEELQARSDGRMKLEIFPASQLGPEADMVQQMTSGSVDFGYITSAYLASRSPELNAWFMPFLFKDVKEAVEMRDSESAKELLKVFDEQGLVGMDWLFTGSHSILMKEDVMDTPEAFVGKKIRAPGSEVINDFYEELGASPSPMPLPEVYQALQTGIVDGVNASANSAYTQKFYEVASEFTQLNQFAFNAAVLMSKATYDKLSEEDRKIVTEAMTAAIDYGNELAIQETFDNLAALKEAGLNIHEVTNFDVFNEVKEKIYNKYSEQSPLIKQFIEEAQSK